MCLAKYLVLFAYLNQQRREKKTVSYLLIGQFLNSDNEAKYFENEMTNFLQFHRGNFTAAGEQWRQNHFWARQYVKCSSRSSPDDKKANQDHLREGNASRINSSGWS
jgi:hypothetical protein